MKENILHLLLPFQEQENSLPLIPNKRTSFLKLIYQVSQLSPNTLFAVCTLVYQRTCDRKTVTKQGVKVQPPYFLIISSYSFNSERRCTGF